MNAQTENPLAKFDAAALKGIDSTTGDFGAPRALFLPSGFGEAMELAKLMSAGLAVPPHLRGKPADCLAVLMQSARWGLDPFAVASKSYFVNDRMAYEAQLVIAVLNTSGVLKGRLDIQWDRTETDLICTVTGTLKADTRPKQVQQGMASIKVKNSPLWTAAPQQQLGYYTSRMWARLFAPEVLLGVYTVDEIQDMGVDNARDAAPAAPTRRQVRQQRQPAQEPQPEVVIEGNAVEVPPGRTEEVESAGEEETARALDAQTQGWQEGPSDEQRGEANNVAQEPEPEAEQNWSATLGQIEEQLDRREIVADVNSYWASIEPMLDDAPESIFNRAAGLRNARVAELRAAAGK